MSSMFTNKKVIKPSVAKQISKKLSEFSKGIILLFCLNIKKNSFSIEKGFLFFLHFVCTNSHKIQRRNC